MSEQFIRGDQYRTIEPRHTHDWYWSIKNPIFFKSPHELQTSQNLLLLTLTVDKPWILPNNKTTKQRWLSSGCVADWWPLNVLCLPCPRNRATASYWSPLRHWSQIPGKASSNCGCATNRRGGVESVADVTARPNSKLPVQTTHFLKEEEVKEDKLFVKAGGIVEWPVMHIIDRKPLKSAFFLFVCNRALLNSTEFSGCFLTKVAQTKDPLFASYWIN